MNVSNTTDVPRHSKDGVDSQLTPPAPFWRRKSAHPFWRLLNGFIREANKLIELFRIAPPVTSQVLRRIELMEQHIILPIKAAWIAILLRPANYSWIGEQATNLEVNPRSAYAVFWVYVAISIVAGIVILFLRRLPPRVSEGTVFATTLVDGIFLGVLTVVTGGYSSPLYYIFLALIVRTAVNVPRPTSQLLLNLTLSTCFVLAGVIDSYVAQNLVSETDKRVIELYADNPGEPLLLRLVLLLLMTLCCYALQVLLERHRQALEEAREFALREGQLRSAGRLAAEFAHQIKNPLAIINTAAFSLQRALRDAKGDAVDQIQMIQEEVERADRIITQVMGYSQLSEGHVEKLNVVEELDRAIERVFPPAAHFPLQVHRSYQGSFPPLLMLRRHVSETFINVLQNAREALESRGANIYVDARLREDESIEVTIRDDGPGIAPDKLGRIFEAYYTTKEKGSGLGLATVKHNLELYGGGVRVESELGKGARFVLLFPARTLMKMAQTNR
ncbi:MAG TPA: HAMP domain-containing sensor histidine kinase [Verrucomicrobiae bacterium]|nr:HAMP domain-containing sensor histidine kinase [Verrucomicrobiae bacterium]